MFEEWLKTLLDGSIGAFVAAGIAAWAVIHSIQREDRQDREQRQQQLEQRRGELEQRKEEAETTLKVTIAQMCRLAGTLAGEVGLDRRNVSLIMQLQMTVLEVIARASASYPRFAQVVADLSEEAMARWRPGAMPTFWRYRHRAMTGLLALGGAGYAFLRAHAEFEGNDRWTAQSFLDDQDDDPPKARWLPLRRK